MTSIIGANRERRKKKRRRDLHRKKKCRKSTERGGEQFCCNGKDRRWFFRWKTPSQKRQYLCKRWWNLCLFAARVKKNTEKCRLWSGPFFGFCFFFVGEMVKFSGVVEWAGWGLLEQVGIFLILVFGLYLCAGGADCWNGVLLFWVPCNSIELKLFYTYARLSYTSNVYIFIDNW